MGKFVKGQPRPPGAGRKPGSSNKTTRQFKEATLRAFAAIGGDKAFARWARRNKSEFYKIAARLIPVEASVTAPAPRVTADDLTALELARRVAFVLSAGDRIRQAQQQPAPVPALPPPDPVPVYREVDRRTERQAPDGIRSTPERIQGEEREVQGEVIGDDGRAVGGRWRPGRFNVVRERG